MPWTGPTFIRVNEDYSGASVWQSDAAASILIQSVRHDFHDFDLANGIDACLNKNGANTATANIGMGGFKLTNIGNGASATDSAAYGQTITASSLSGANILTLTRAAGNITVDLTPLVVGGSIANFPLLNANNTFTGTTNIFNAVQVTAGNGYRLNAGTGSILQWDIYRDNVGLYVMRNGGEFLRIPNAGTDFYASSNIVWTQGNLTPATLASYLTTAGSYAVTGTWNFNGGVVILPTGTTFGATGGAWQTNVTTSVFQLFAVSSSALLKVDYDATEGTRIYAGAARAWTNNNLRTSLVVAPTGGVNGDLAVVPTGAQRGLWQNLAGTWTKLIAFP